MWCCKMLITVPSTCPFSILVIPYVNLSFAAITTILLLSMPHSVNAANAAGQCNLLHLTDQSSTQCLGAF